MADDVVGDLLKLFSLRETDSAWHGGCLAVAELGRRGLLLPQRLPEVTKVLLKALIYDERKGMHSVGSHIRDAACYVCWSLARAFDPEIMRPHVAVIASSLINVAIFDREVQCRRAASAAFQENVGRQGTFPHGIDIVTEADYFAVGSRQNTYLKLSVFVGGFSEYADSVIDHLVETKIGHWDIGVRELTANALHNLTPIAPVKMAQSVLPALLKEVNAIELFTKHGAIVCVGHVIKALSIVAQDQGKKLQDLIGEFSAEWQPNFVLCLTLFTLFQTSRPWLPSERLPSVWCSVSSCAPPAATSSARPLPVSSTTAPRPRFRPTTT